jgi:peptidoglycan/xylan/chitin deacetylase (PgdA/CDA1 family)
MRAILTYHSIDPSGSPISIDESAFARHVAFLASGAVRVVPLETLAALPATENAVALTFDDGFENFATIAWPRLAAAGLPATVFLVSDHAGRDNRWGGRSEAGIPELPLMDWETAGRVAGEGAGIGSHTRTHASLPSLDDDALADELVTSRERIAAETGVDPVTFCFPYGDHDERTTAAVRSRYRLACTTELALVPDGCDPHLAPRLDAYYLREPGRIETFGTASFRRYVERRAWLRRVRARVMPARRGCAAAHGRRDAEGPKV